MFPIAPILIAAAIAARSAGAAKKGSPAPVYLVKPVLSPVWVWTIAIFLIPLVAIMFEPYYGTANLVLWLLASPFLFPWLFVRRVLVPLRLTGAAVSLTRWSGIVWRGDQQAGPAVAGAWSLLRTSAHNAALATKLSDRVAARPPLMSGGILACGLLAASRGDLDSARRLIRSAGTLHQKATPRVVRELATEWLVVDCAERGDWKAVLEASRRSGPHTALSRLIEGVAARETGAPYSAASIRLFTSWLLGLRWFSTWPLLRRGLSGPVARKRSASGPQAKLDDPLGLALSFQVRLMSTPPRQVTAERVVATGLAWDAAFADPTLPARIAKRALVLAYPMAGDTTSQLRASTVNDLVAIIGEAGLPFETWRGGSEILDSVASRLRESLLTEIEEMCGRLRARVQAKRALPVIDEWREYVEIRRVYEESVERGGMDVRRLAFAQIHGPVCSLGVWLYNSRQEKPLGHAMFAWLAQEATAVGDQAAITLQTKNTAYGPGL